MLYTFDEARRLPCSTREELIERERVHDMQMLLHEEYDHYAQRTDVGQGSEEGGEVNERAKWVNETWEEQARRKGRQAVYLRQAEATQEALDEARRAHDAQQASRSAEVVARLMEMPAQLDATRTQSRHHLFADFVEYQQVKFARQHDIVAAAERMSRDLLVAQEECLSMTLLATMQPWHATWQARRQRDRESREEEARQRRQEEAQRAAEEARQREEQRRREEEEARRAARERAEQEKRLERKRREDERRARARAEAGEAKHVTE